MQQHHKDLRKALRQRKIHYIVVHCSATQPDDDYTALRCHQDHMSRGWSKIGYHFYIERDGSVVRGRDIDEVGAHVQGYNENSLGICMEGGYDSSGRVAAAYTRAQWKSLKATMSFLRTTYPDARIQGHRDFPDVNKACPSFDVKDWLELNL